MGVVTRTPRKFVILTTAIRKFLVLSICRDHEHAERFLQEYTQGLHFLCISFALSAEQIVAGQWYGRSEYGGKHRVQRRAVVEQGTARQRKGRLWIGQNRAV